MAKRRDPRSSSQRALIARTAAKIMTEQGIRDFYAAKTKAAERLGISGKTPNMPRNTEIEAAVSEHLRLFYGDSQPQTLTALREQALEAMRFFRDFRPRLVGPVLSGTATGSSTVGLHLFADTPEHVALHLIERDIPHDLEEKRLRVRPEGYRNYPVFRFEAGGVTIEATVFDRTALRQPPLSPVDGKPMQRADIREVESLLQGDPDAPTPLVG